MPGSSWYFITTSRLNSWRKGEKFMNEREFEVIELTGTPYDRGVKLGSKKSDEISSLVNFLFAKLADNNIQKKPALKHIKKHIPVIEDYSPEIADELKGIADGANRQYEDIVLLTMMEEFKGFSHNCTSFAVTGNATKSGDTFIGQSWDIPKDLCKQADSIMLKMRRNSGPDFLAYTYSGLIAGAGINTAGISLVWNSVPRLRLDIGVPTYVIIEEILRQETIGAAIAAICRADRAGCFNFLITDRSEIYNIEATPDDIDVSYSCSYTGHANHYISDKFKDKQDIAAVGRSYDASSIIRHNRINRLLTDNCSSIDIELLKKFLQDHVNHPEAICRHLNPKIKNDDKQIITCTSFIMTPAKGEIIITNGTPCENKFSNYCIKKKKGD